jgi:hypothetical protein
LVDALALKETATAYLPEGRGGRNMQHQLVALLRQSVYGHLSGYEDINPSRDGLNGLPGTRLLRIVDHFTHESPAIQVDGSLGGRKVVAALARLALHGRLHKTISVDNGPEFTSKALDR